MAPEMKKEIVDLLKKEGLEIGEDSAELLVKAIFKILPIIAAKTENTMDDMLVGAMAPILEREVLKLVDKIDGEIDA